MIDGSELRNDWLNLDIQSPYVIEMDSKEPFGLSETILKDFQVLIK